MPKGRALRALAAAVAATHLVGCATPTPVAFQPRQQGEVGEAGGNAVAAGGAARVTLPSGVRLTMHSTWRLQPLDEPTFTLRVVNGSPGAIRLERGGVRATFRGEPVPLASRAERLREVRAAEDRRDALRVVVGTVAVVAALWGIAGGWDGVVRAGGGSVVVQTPLGGLAAGVAVAAVGDEALQRFDIDDPVARRAVADAILDGRTVGPGQSASVQLVLERCCAGALRSDDAIRIAVAVGAETAVFEFLRVPAEDPTRLLRP